MPGFCGWIGAETREDARSMLDAMAAGLWQRPGETVRSWTCDFAALAVAGRDDGVLHVDEHFAIAISGAPRWEDVDLAKEAAAHGFARSVAIAARRSDAALPALLKGSFSLALIDLEVRRAVLAIDRVGIESLAHAERGGALLFGSRLDALAAHPAVEAAVSPQAVYRYAMNFVSPAPCTIYDGASKLLPGFLLDFRAQEGRTELRPYWRTPYDPYARVDARQARDALFSHLERSVRRALAQGSPDAGAFLSGGLDSSTVAGLLARQNSGKATAYTIIFDDPRYDEGPYARLAAGHFGLAHREYCLQPEDVVTALPDVVRVFDEPFGNSSVIPALFCARMARSEVGLLLAGDGGDELFAGNKRYAEQMTLAFYERVPGPVRRLAEGLLDPLPPSLAFGPFGKLRRYVRRARLPVPERMHNPIVYARDALSDVFAPEALAAIDIEEPYEIWMRHYRESGTDDLLASMLHLDMRITIADNDIRKVNGACLLADIDVAYPMLDDDLVTFAAGLPSDLLLKGRELRHFYKTAMEGFLPDDILTKKKHGFGMPFSEWTASHPALREIVADSFSSLGERGLFRPDFLERARSDHLAGIGAPTDSVIWDLVMLELWLRDRAPRLSI